MTPSDWHIGFMIRDQTKLHRRCLARGYSSWNCRTELLKYKGVPTDHIAIRTSSYAGIGEQSDDIRVHGLHYIIENMNAEDSC